MSSVSTDEGLAAHLVECIQRGDTTGVLNCLHGVDEKTRRGLLPAVNDAVSAQPAMVPHGDMSNMRTISEHWQRAARAQQAAQLACTTGAAASARLITRNGGWINDHANALRALTERNVDWLPDLLARLADDDRVWNMELTEGLRITIGSPYPETDAYLRRLVLPAMLSREVAVLDRLRADPELLGLVPRMLDVPDIGESFAWQENEHSWDGQKSTRQPRPQGQRWSGALALLAADGSLDRALLLDRALGALLRGGRRGHISWMVTLHDELAPAPEEVVARASKYRALLIDGTGKSAGMAQRMLRAADDARLLDDDDMWAITAAVLTRPEKSIAVAQLRWAKARARRTPADAGRAAVAVAVGARHENADVCAQTLTALESWWPELPTAVRAEIAPELELVPPSFASRVRMLVGGDSGPADVREHGSSVVRPAARRAEVPSRIGSLHELREAAAHVLVLPDPDVLAIERVADGILAFCGDLAALRETLLPLTPATDEAFGWYMPAWPLRLLLRDVLRIPAAKPPFPATPETLHRRLGVLDRLFHRQPAPLVPEVPQLELKQPPSSSDVSGADWLLAARFAEVRADVLAGRAGRLLALPTHVPGILDVDEFLARCRAACNGWQQRPLDLEQALLRLDPNEREQAMRSAGIPLDRTPTAQPQLHLQTVTVSQRPLYAGATAHVRDYVFALFTDPRPAAPVARAVYASVAFSVNRLTENRYRPAGDPRQVLAAAPWQRDVAAAAAAVELIDRPARLPATMRDVLLALPDAGGPSGAGTAVLLARGALGENGVDRLTTADVIVTLWQTKAMDAALTAAALAELVVVEGLPVRRATETLRAIATAAEWSCVWDLCAALLPPLLAAGTREVTGVLTLACDAAATLGINGSISGLDEVADRRSETKLVAEARRLRSVLCS